MGKTPRILKSGKTPPAVFEELWKTIKAGNEWKGEFCNRKKNGELYWESASISPVKELRVFKVDDGSSADCGTVKFECNVFALTVTATDDCGNEGTGSDIFVFPSKHDGHSHDDDTGSGHKKNKK